MKFTRIRTYQVMVFALFAAAFSHSQGQAQDAATESDTVASAQTYVDQFIKDDVEACFGDVELGLAQVDGKPGGTDHQSLRRAIVLVDGSGSMAGRLDGRSKLDLAREAARTFIKTLPHDAEAAVIVFGQQGDNTPTGKAQSCTSVDTLAPMTSDQPTLIAALTKISAVGWTPLAAAITQAQAMFQKSSPPGEQVIYVVSDGEETCGGNPIEAARQVNEGGTRAIVNIIGFGLPAKEASVLQSVATAGGGTFVDVQTSRAFDETMAAVREANRVAGNVVRSSNAISANAVDTADIISRANICISDIVSDESNRMADDLSDRASRGEPVPYMHSALSLLKDRHRELEDRLKTFSEHLKAAERDTRIKIDNATDPAQ